MAKASIILGASPFGDVWRAGRLGRSDGPPATTLQWRPATMQVEILSYGPMAPGLVETIAATVDVALDPASRSGLATETLSVIRHGADRMFVVSDDPSVLDRLHGAISIDEAMIVDQSHGRTRLGLAGEGSEWLLSKLHALDFSLGGFPVGHGTASAHHQIHVLIQRRETQAFDLYPHRSYARTYLELLIDAGLEQGLEILPLDGA